MENNQIKLTSNIVLKSKYQVNGQQYLPADLLPKEYRDVRLLGTLTPLQRRQMEKRLFLAKDFKEEYVEPIQ